MFLKLAHTRLDIFLVSKKLVIDCYKVVKSLPVDERFGLSRQICRAATFVHLNIAEGCSRTSSAERKRFFEIARGSLIEVDTGIDIAIELDYLKPEQTIDLETGAQKIFQMISKLIRTCNV